MDTIKAEIFKYVGIVMIKGEDGKITWLMIKPATILPTASRLIGLTMVGLFSLAYKIGLYRGDFIDAKKIIRRLYTAVNEVAIIVKIRAQAFTLE